MGTSHQYVTPSINTLKKLGIKNVTECALKNFRSKLSTSNIVQELFSSFAARWVCNGSSRSSLSHSHPSSHKEILDMEIQFLHENFAEKDFKSLMDHIQSMACGEAPFFAITLSLVYGGLIKKAFSKHAPLGSDLGGQSVATPTPHLQASTPTPSLASSSNLRAPTPVPEPVLPDPTVRRIGLKCARCCGVASVHDLHDGLYCPRCPNTGRNGRGERGRPFMRCMGCNNLRDVRTDGCVKFYCSDVFA